MRLAAMNASVNLKIPKIGGLNVVLETKLLRKRGQHRDIEDSDAAQGL
jgi:hypothetical protein